MTYLSVTMGYRWVTEGYRKWLLNDSAVTGHPGESGKQEQKRSGEWLNVEAIWLLFGQ